MLVTLDDLDKLFTFNEEKPSSFTGEHYVVHVKPISDFSFASQERFIVSKSLWKNYPHNYTHLESRLVTEQDVYNELKHTFNLICEEKTNFTTHNDNDIIEKWKQWAKKHNPAALTWNGYRVHTFATTKPFNYRINPIYNMDFTLFEGSIVECRELVKAKGW